MLRWLLVNQASDALIVRDVRDPLNHVKGVETLNFARCY